MTLKTPDYKQGFFALLGFLVTIALTLGGWSMSRTVVHESHLGEIGQRLESVEVNRFTAADALQMEIMFRAELQASVTEIKRCLNQIQRKDPCDL